MTRRSPRAMLTLWCTLGVLAWGVAAAPQTTARRVLLLYSYQRDFSPHRAFAQQFRPELSRRSPEPLEFIEVSLQPARLTGARDEEIARRIRSLVTAHQPHLVVPIGGPAAAFAQRNREALFPETAVLLAGVDERFVRGIAMSERDTVVPVDHEPARLVENILRVLPATKTVFVVIGSSTLERSWLDEMKRAFRRFEGTLTFSWTNQLSFAEILERSAELPSHSAILLAVLSRDAKGEPVIEDDALAALRASANAPIFGVRSTQLGHGIVGGPLVPVEDMSRDTARVALGLLNGEPPHRFRPATLRLAAPVFDARELRRWNIGEDRLPPGSTVRFRDPTTWQRYKWTLVLGVALIATQLIVVAAVLASRGRRRRAAVTGLSRSLLQANERERAAVAREIQDDLCQRMIALTIRLRQLGHAPAHGEHGAIQRDVDNLSGELGALASKFFAVSDQLRSSKVDLLGLAAASRTFCRELSAEHGVAIEFHDDAVPADLSNDIAQPIFAVMQEAVRNAVRHSGVRYVVVTLSGGRGEIRLEVADAGVGFDPEQAMTGRGLGLLAMKDRLSVMDGECAIESRPGAGTRIRVRVRTRPRGTA